MGALCCQSQDAGPNKLLVEEENWFKQDQPQLMADKKLKQMLKYQQYKEDFDPERFGNEDSM